MTHLELVSGCISLCVRRSAPDDTARFSLMIPDLARINLLIGGRQWQRLTVRKPH